MCEVWQEILFLQDADWSAGCPPVEQLEQGKRGVFMRYLCVCKQHFRKIAIPIRRPLVAKLPEHALESVESLYQPLTLY